MCHTEKMKVVKTMVPGLLLSTLPLCSASPWTATPPPFSQHVGLYVLMGDVVVERLDVRGMCNIGKLQNLNSKNPSPPCSAASWARRRMTHDAPDHLLSDHHTGARCPISYSESLNVNSTTCGAGPRVLNAVIGWCIFTDTVG